MKSRSSMPDVQLEQVCLGQEDTMRSSSKTTTTTTTTTTACRASNQEQHQSTTHRMMQTACQMCNKATILQTTRTVCQASTARQVQAAIHGMTRTACHASETETTIVDPCFDFPQAFSQAAHLAAQPPDDIAMNAIPQPDETQSMLDSNTL